MDTARNRPGDAIPSFVDVACTYIRDRITTGQYPPGMRLKERELVTELGISRIPIREAFRELSKEGFLAVQPRRGVAVRRLVPADLDDIFEVREALEVQAAVLCARKASADDVTALQETIAQAEQALAAGNLELVEKYNQLFHTQIITFAHSPLLREILEPLQSRLNWLLSQNDDPTSICREHAAIATAIAAKNTRTARRLALRHVETSRRLAQALLFGS